MAWFEYEGVCPNGTAIAGRIEAEDREAARLMLSETLRLSVGDVRAATSPPRRAPVSDEDFIFFNEQLASLASAGMALDEGLQQLARDVTSPRLRRLIQDVVADLQRGQPLEEAIARRENQFPSLYGRVIRAGVQTGQLPATLLNLNQHLRLMGETRRILWETLTYPLVVLMMAFAIASFFFLMVAPKIREVYADFGAVLPSLTLLLMGVSDAYVTILIAVAAIGIGLLILWQLLRTTPGGRKIRETVAGAVPLFGRVYRASLVSRFVRSVATCVRAGLPLPESLRLAGGVTGSERMTDQADRLAAAVEQGQSIFDAAQLCPWIPGIFGYTLQAAIGRDAIPVALAELAATYESRATHLLALLRTVLFPTLVIVVGLILGTGIVAIFLPLVTLINSVSGG